jgi:hypothetical protein
MRSSSLLLLTLLAAPALAQVPAQGFALERLDAAPAGAGWLQNDELNLDGPLAGAASFTMGYAHLPLRVGGLGVVTHQAFGTVAAAVQWTRFRLSVDLVAPVDVSGVSGEVAGVTYTAPAVNLEQNPDAISDVRLGLEARLFGAPGAAFRFGVGVQLYVPSGAREQYVSDETLRSVARALFAGDVRWFSWAAHLGVHARPLDDGTWPQSPRGPEALAGLALGARLTPGGPGLELLVGPELSAVTAFKAALQRDTTGLEALISARLEHHLTPAVSWRVRLAGGVGLHPSFGVPAWRVVLGVELLGHE